MRAHGRLGQLRGRRGRRLRSKVAVLQGILRADAAAGVERDHLAQQRQRVRARLNRQQALHKDCLHHKDVISTSSANVSSLSASSESASSLA